MFPSRLALIGMDLSVWNAIFILGTLVGYGVLWLTFRTVKRRGIPRLLVLRWIVTAYVSIVGAQMFAYVFDLNTTVLPPYSTSWLRYYFDPLAGPKTLYGAIVFLPLGVFLVSAPWRDLSPMDALDLWTPALMTVLAISRVGCLLQGCCYGTRSSLGLTFPEGSPAYVQQVHDGVIAPGSAALPVVPTQALEAIVLFAIAGWGFARLRRGEERIFVPAILGYSVARFVLEFVRADVERNAFGPLSSSQWIALVVLSAWAAWRLTSGHPVPLRASDSPR